MEGGRMSPRSSVERNGSASRGHSVERKGRALSWRPIQSSNVSSHCKADSYDWSPRRTDYHSYHHEPHVHRDRVIHNFVKKDSVTHNGVTDSEIYRRRDVLERQRPHFHAKEQSGRGQISSDEEDAVLNRALYSYNKWAKKNNSPILTLDQLKRSRNHSRLL
jgi:hypothetical protein